MEENAIIPVLKPNLSRRETARKRRTEHENERRVVQNRCTEFTGRSIESVPSISPVSSGAEHPLGKGKASGSNPLPGTIIAENTAAIARMKTTTRGSLSEAEVLATLARLGASVFIPAVGHDHSFDMIAAWGGNLSRVQVKTMRQLANGSIMMSGASVVDRVGGKQWPCLTTADCDVIVGWFPAEARAYAVSPKGQGSYSFRMQPPRNNQVLGVVLAADYELTRLEQLLPDYPRL